MSYLTGFVFALALVASPLSVSAQDAEEAATPEPSAEEAAPSSEPAPEEPALKLELDDAGVEVVPSPPRTPDGYTLEEMELRVTRAKFGLRASGGTLAGGALLFVIGAAEELSCEGYAPGDCEPPPHGVPLMISGGVIMVGGLAGMIASAVLRKKRRRELRRLLDEYYPTRRLVQWDVARSRLVF